MPPRTPAKRTRDALLFACVIAGTALATLPSFGNGFVWDDLQVIVHGTVIHDPAELPRALARRTMYVSSGALANDPRASIDSYRPLTVATFFLDAAISGRDPWAYHLTNFLAHLVCVALVFLSIRRVVPSSSSVVAAISAAWFGLTPHLAEAHVWINGRSDVLCTLFGLTSMLAWLTAIERTGRARIVWHTVAATSLLLGLFCKETLLFAIPCFVLTPGASSTLRQRSRHGLGLGLAGAGYLVVRSMVLDGMRAGSGAEQIGLAMARYPAVVLDGLLEVLVPMRLYVRSLSDDYDALGTSGLAGCALALVALAFFAWRIRTRAPLVAWAIVAFATTVVPAALVATVMWPGFGRYLYLPSALLAIGLGDLFRRALEHPRIVESKRAPRWLVIGAWVWVTALGLRLYTHVPAFHDERALWSSVVDAAPDRAHGWGYLGITLLEEGEAELALPMLARAESMDPSEPRYLLQLGWALHVTGRTQASLDACAAGIERFPPGGVFRALAARNLAGSRPDLASRHLDTCFSAEPGNAECVRARADIERSNPDARP